jgi:hypothetical protein
MTEFERSRLQRVPVELESTIKKDGHDKIGRVFVFLKTI